MKSPQYVSLHNHSETSLLDGLAQINEYLDVAEELGMRGFGLTDHGNNFSLYSFLKACEKRGMVGVPGMEAYVAPINPEGARVKNPVYYGPGGRKASKYDVSSDGSYLHLSMWAVNSVGLHNLFKLSTLSYQPENWYSKPRIDFEMIADHAEGLVVSTGCPSSEVSTRLLLGQDKKAIEYAGRLKELFGEERLFVEVMNHHMEIELERILLPKQVALAKKLGVKLLATNDSHYARKKDALHHEELLCVQSGSRMSDKTYDQGGKRFAFSGDQYYLKSAAEMAELFPEDEFPNALSSSLLVAEMAQDLTIDFDPTLKPHALVPEGYDELSYFKELVNKGFKERYGKASPEVRAEAKARLANEFKVIHSSNFIGYFLTVQEYLKWTRDNYSTLGPNDEILALPIGPGRGSVGGSITAYVLYISEVDPIRFDLIFERFLSAGRGDTYRISYDDGSYEDVVVSDERIVVSGAGVESRYIHQLEVGDEVQVAEA